MIQDPRGAWLLGHRAMDRLGQSHSHAKICDGRAPACEGVNVPCYNRAPTLPFVFSRMDQTVREHIAAQEERLKALSAQLMEEPHARSAMLSKLRFAPPT